jgi:hypothetical protein
MSSKTRPLTPLPLQLKHFVLSLRILLLPCFFRIILEGIIRSNQPPSEFTVFYASCRLCAAVKIAGFKPYTPSFFIGRNPALYSNLRDSLQEPEIEARVVIKRGAVHTYIVGECLCLCMCVIWPSVYIMSFSHCGSSSYLHRW